MNLKMSLFKIRLKVAFTVLFGKRRFMFVDLPDSFPPPADTTISINTFWGGIDKQNAYELTATIADSISDELEYEEGLRISNN